MLHSSDIITFLLMEYAIKKQHRKDGIFKLLLNIPDFIPARLNPWGKIVLSAFLDSILTCVLGLERLPTHTKQFPRHHLGILRCNSILTLSNGDIIRSTGEGLRPKSLPHTLSSDTSHKLRVFPVLRTHQLQIGGCKNALQIRMPIVSLGRYLNFWLTGHK